MSRIGKKPITVPKGVTVSLKGQEIAVKGPKGELKRAVAPLVKVAVAGTEVTVTRDQNDGATRAQHGLMRALVQNMILGVTTGFERKLEINGVGYKAEIAGEKVTLSLGYSHPIVFTLPKGVSVKVEKNVLSLSGIDKELVGLCAAKVRSFRPPEPYKGKGVKYLEEHIRRKVGKTGAA